MSMGDYRIRTQYHGELLVTATSSGKEGRSIGILVSLVKLSDSFFVKVIENYPM